MKVLVENVIEDLVILEASEHICGRILKEHFGGVSVELGASWIADVHRKESNLVWDLTGKSDLRTCFSDYNNARYNIYDLIWMTTDEIDDCGQHHSVKRGWTKCGSGFCALQRLGRNSRPRTRIGGSMAWNLLTSFIVPELPSSWQQ